MLAHARCLVPFASLMLAGCCGTGDEPRIDATPSASSTPSGATARSSARPAGSRPPDVPAVVRQAVWSPDAARFAYWTEGENRVDIWDALAMKRLAVLEVDEAPSPYRVLGWSPDGSRFVSHYYGNVFLWDAAAWKRLASYTIFASNESMAFSPDGSRLLLSGAFGRLMLVDARSGAKLRVQSMHDPAAALESGIWWSPDNETTVYADNSGLVQLRNSRTGNVRRTLRKATDDAPLLPVVAFSPSGGRLAWMGEGDAIALVRAGSGQEERRIPTGTKVDPFHPHGPGALAFSPDGKLLAAVTGDRAVRVWDVASGAERATLQAPREAESFEIHDTVTFNTSGKLLAWRASSDGSFGVWRTDGSADPKVMRNAKAEACSIAWPPRGDVLVCQRTDTIELWSPAEDKLVGSLRGNADQRSFVPGTDVLSVAGDGVLLHRVHDGASVRVKPGPSGDLEVAGEKGKAAGAQAVSRVLGRE